MALDRESGAGRLPRGIDVVRHNLFLLHRTIVILMLLWVLLFLGMLFAYSWFLLTWQDVSAAWQYWRGVLAAEFIPASTLFLVAHTPTGVAVNIGPMDAETGVQAFRPWWNFVFGAVMDGVLPITIFATLAVVALRIVFIRVGDASGEKIQIDGARLIKPAHAIREMGKKRSPFSLAGVPYPPGGETEWTYLNGGTGSGKTTAIRMLLHDLREQQMPAVIYDPSREFIAEFYDPARDVIFDPADARFPGWCPLVDVADDIDFDTFAQCLIEVPPQQDPFFAQAAQILLAEALRNLYRKKLYSNRAVYNDLTIERLDALHDSLIGTAAATISDPLSERMAFSVRQSAINQLYVFRYLTDDQNTFSIRHWVKNCDERKDGGFLFISTHENYQEVFRPLLTLWVNIVIKATLGLTPSHGRARFWFIIDEASDFAKINLELAVRKARKNGLAGLIAVQHPKQLEERFGKNRAETIVDTCRTKLILRSDNAEPLAKMLGKADFIEQRQTTSFGTGSLISRGDTENVGEQKQEDLVVKARDIEHLPSDDKTIHGFLKRTGIKQIVKVKFSRPEYVGQAEFFVRRQGFAAMPEQIDAPSGGGTAAEAEADPAVTAPKKKKPEAQSGQRKKSGLLGKVTSTPKQNAEQASTPEIMQASEIPSVIVNDPSSDNGLGGAVLVDQNTLEQPSTETRPDCSTEIYRVQPGTVAESPDESLLKKLGREQQWLMRQIIKNSKSGRLTGRIVALNVGTGISANELASHGLPCGQLLAELMMLGWIWRSPNDRPSLTMRSALVDGERISLLILKPEIVEKLGLVAEAMEN